MSAYSITYRDRHKVAVPVTREQYIAIRNSSSNLANLNMARKGNKYAKMSLVQMNYSCYPNSDGSLKGATMVSGTVGMDVDHLLPSPTSPTTSPIPSDWRGDSHNGDGSVSPQLEGTCDSHNGGGSVSPLQLEGMGEVDILAKNIVSRAQELDIYMVEKSASGCGLHIVFKRNPELSNEENIVRMAEKLGVEPDMGAKDITRVFFSSSAEPRDLILLRDELFADNEKHVNYNAVVGATGESKPVVDDNFEVRDDYNGIPYSKIIQTWWDMFYGGKEPTELTRNTATFELAVNLRHICGFSEKQLRHIIPCYDGFPISERDACIASAVSSKRTMMPKRMIAVLTKLQQKNSTDIELVDQIEKEKVQADRIYYDQLPPLPSSTQMAIDIAGDTLAMPTIMSLGTICGFYATNVKLTVHGIAKGLSLHTFVAGESGSGKDAMTRLFEAWVKSLQEKTDMMHEEEKAWADEASTKLSGTIKKAPKTRVLIIPFNNTIPNIAKRLEEVKGTRAISYCSESDTIFTRWRGCMPEFTVMLRTAYDEGRFDREAASAGAIRAHIPHLLWNTIMCGTQDALYRLVDNVTDGFMNRLCLARTLDNTWTPFGHPDRPYTEEELAHCNFVADSLHLMSGTLTSEVLENWLLEWIETVRLEALKSLDRVYARARFRSPITALRLTVAAYLLPRVLDKMVEQYGSRDRVKAALNSNREAWIPFAISCIDEDTHQFFKNVADYVIDTQMFFFRDELQEAYNDERYSRTIAPTHKSETESLFDALPNHFTTSHLLDEYIHIKKKSPANSTILNILSVWKKQGLIDGARGSYSKVNLDFENRCESEPRGQTP